MICGADGWVEIYEFGLAKESWLRTFLTLPNGIPSPDMFARVFALLDPAEFAACFAKWISSLSIDLIKEIIAIDGKTVRGSGNKTQGHPVIHLVNAWATHNRLMLAQVKTADKSNEITAIPEVLKRIDVKEAIITIDAMGCQTKIARQIIRQEGGSVLSLEGKSTDAISIRPCCFCFSRRRGKEIQKHVASAKSGKTA